MARTTKRRLKELHDELYIAAGSKQQGDQALADCRKVISQGFTLSPYKDGAWALSWFEGSGGVCRWRERWIPCASQIVDGTVVQLVNEIKASV